LGSTRSGKGTDAGEESAKLAALCPEVKEGRKRERERERGTRNNICINIGKSFSLTQAIFSTDVIGNQIKNAITELHCILQHLSSKMCFSK